MKIISLIKPANIKLLIIKMVNTLKFIANIINSALNQILIKINDSYTIVFCTISWLNHEDDISFVESLFY